MNQIEKGVEWLFPGVDGRVMIAAAIVAGLIYYLPKHLFHFRWEHIPRWEVLIACAIAIGIGLLVPKYRYAIVAGSLTLYLYVLVQLGTKTILNSSSFSKTKKNLLFVVFVILLFFAAFGFFVGIAIIQDLLKVKLF